MFEKENTVFTDSKDRQVKHYYPEKQAVTLRIELNWIWPKRISEGSKKSAIFLFSTWNLYLREIIFVTDVAVLTIETFLIERPV